MALGRLVVLALLGLALASEAHLKLFYHPYQLPVRNGLSPTSDGVFSAAANKICGGSDQWGRNNQRRYAHVVDGQTLCTRVNWNGGHSTTVNENRLRVLFRCNRPADQQNFLQTAQVIPISTLSNPQPEKNLMSIDGRQTNALWEGYTVCVDLPVQNITPDLNENSAARQCSIAIVEGNNWGGCHDLLLYPNAANGGTRPAHTGVPVPSPAEYAELLESPMNLNNSEAVYKLENCFTDTGGKCCLYGYFAVRKDGAVSARFRGGDDFDTCFELSWGNRDYQMILRPSKFSKDVYETNFYLNMGYDRFGRKVTEQNMSLTLREGGGMFISNVGLDVPEVADHDVIRFTSLEDGVRMGLVPRPRYSTVANNIPWNIVIAAGVGGLVVLYLVGGVMYSVCTNGRCEHPHIHACLVGLGCVRKRRKKITHDDDIEKPIEGKPIISKPKSGFSIQLPPDWQTAIDPMSGEVYYYNIKTKQTTWTRPN